MNIASVLSLDPDMPVASVTATIKKIWPTKKGIIGKGPRKGEPWHKQDIVLEDNSGEITISNWGEELPRSDVGETFMFASHKNKKNQLVGLKVEYDDYKKSNIIVMNESAKITLPDGSVVPSNKEASGDDANTERQSVAPARSPMELALAAKEGCRLAMRMALELRQEMHQEYGEVTGEDINAEQVNSWASSINYFLRDQGVYKQLIGTKPSEQATAKPAQKTEPLPEASSPADDDEIPF